MSDLQPITLQELNDAAAMLTRTDRKYVVRPGELAAVVSMMPGPVRVLDIEGHRSFAYESVYFDTPELASYLAAARKRRHRWKVRTRTYLDSGQCMLEVKVRDEPGPDGEAPDRVRPRRCRPADRQRPGLRGRAGGPAGRRARAAADSDHPLHPHHVRDGHDADDGGRRPGVHPPRRRHGPACRNC